MMSAAEGVRFSINIIPHTAAETAAAFAPVTSFARSARTSRAPT
jgi:hypothetical protein